MADIKISELPLRPTLQASDEFLILAQDANYRAPLSAVEALFDSSAGGGGGFFENVAAVESAAIPSMTQTIAVSGYHEPGKGAAFYHRSAAPTGALAGNRGFLQSLDGAWWKLDVEQIIRVTMFGAVGDNAADDGPAIRHAHAFCANARSGAYIPLRFPVGRYNILTGVDGTLNTAGFLLVDNTNWLGEGGYATERDDLVQIRYAPNSAGSSRHLFSMGGSDKKWCSFIGICFDGKSQRCGMFDGTISAPILWHTVFSFCGFKNFDHAFRNAVSGCMIEKSYWQNCLCAGEFAGADCTIQTNKISGSNWHSGGGTNSDSAGALTFAIKFGSWRMSRFRDNFITGWPQMCCYIGGSVEATIFDANYFDICDCSGLVVENSRGGIFTANTFNRCMIGIDQSKGGSQSNPANDAVTSTDFNAIVRIKSSHNLVFNANLFGYVDGGLPNGISPTTFRVSGSAELTKNIRISNSLYLEYAASPYDKSIVVDAGATAPIET